MDATRSSKRTASKRDRETDASPSESLPNKAAKTEHPPRAAPLKTAVKRVPVGQLGKKFILQSLAKTDPLSFITKFQEENGLRPKCNCTSVLPFVDLLGISRPTVYRDILTLLNDRLLPRLPSMNQEALDKLLAETFPYVQLPELQPIALEVLRLHKQIPMRYISSLSANTELLDLCAIEVKRQVWQAHQSMFKRVVEPLIEAYTLALSAQAATLTFEELARISPRARRDVAEVKKTLELIGSSLKLYNVVLGIVRTKFVETGNLGFCAFRTDILMGLIDSGTSSIFKLDPCHKFVRTLVTCVTERTVDDSQAQQTDIFLNSIQAGTKAGPILGDVGMIILDPSVSYTLATSCYSVLKTLVTKKVIPAESKYLYRLTRVFAATKETRQMIDSQMFSPIENNPQLLSHFYPTLACFLVEDILSTKNALKSKLSRNQAAVKSLQTYFEEAPCMRHIVMQYMVERLRKEDMKTFAWLVPTLINKTTGNWLHGSSDAADTNEQFVRTLVRIFLGSNKIFLADVDLSVGVLENLFVLRSQKSVEAHVQVVKLFHLLRTTTVPALAGAKLDKLVRTVCELGALPEDELDSESTTTLRNAYEFLVERYREGDDVRDDLDAKIAQLSPNVDVPMTTDDVDVGDGCVDGGVVDVGVGVVGGVGGGDAVVDRGGGGRYTEDVDGDVNNDDDEFEQMQEEMEMRTDNADVNNGNGNTDNNDDDAGFDDPTAY